MSARLTSDEIAFAMELHSEGVQWRHIAVGLGCSAGQLRGALISARANGYRPAPGPQLANVRLAHVRREALRAARGKLIEGPLWLTVLQKEYVDFMGAFFSSNDQFPTMRALAEHFDCHPSASYCICKKLESKGVIAKNSLGKWRRGALWPL